MRIQWEESGEEGDEEGGERWGEVGRNGEAGKVVLTMFTHIPNRYCTLPTAANLRLCCLLKQV